MKDLLLTLLHLTVMTATLCGPGGVRAVIAEHLLLKQQLIVLRRPRQRALRHRCVAPDVWPTLSRAMKDLLLTLFHWAVMTATLDAARELGIRDAQGLNRQFSLADLLRQSVYSRLAGDEDLNDAVRVSADPTFRLIGSPKIWDRGTALTSTLHWFETELLTQEEQLVGLRAVHRAVLAQAGRRTQYIHHRTLNRTAT